MPKKNSTPASSPIVHVATGVKAPALDKRKAVIKFAEKHGFNADTFALETGLGDKWEIPVAEAAVDHLVGMGFEVELHRGYVAGEPKGLTPAHKANIAAVNEALAAGEPVTVTVGAGDVAIAKANAAEASLPPIGAVGNGNAADKPKATSSRQKANTSYDASTGRLTVVHEVGHSVSGDYLAFKVSGSRAGGDFFKAGEKVRIVVERVTE